MCWSWGASGDARVLRIVCIVFYGVIINATVKYYEHAYCYVYPYY